MAVVVPTTAAEPLTPPRPPGHVRHLSCSNSPILPAQAMPRTTRRRTSLAYVLGRRISVTVSTLIVMAHIAFGYAQMSGTDTDCPALFTNESECPPSATRPGGLLSIHVNTHVQYEARGVLAGALGALESAACNTTCPSAASASHSYSHRCPANPLSQTHNTPSSSAWPLTHLSVKSN